MFMSRLFIAFSALIFAFSAQAEEGNPFLTLSYYESEHEEQGESAGDIALEIWDMPLGADGLNWGARFGFAVVQDSYQGLDGDRPENYGGTTGSFFFHGNGGGVKPYIATGFMWGEEFTTDCSDEDEDMELCDVEETLYLFPEAGVAVELGEFQISAFARRFLAMYSDRHSRNYYGVSLSVSVD